MTRSVEADIHPDWVAGISIGALNAALIAGNPPERRVARLREFWETITASAAASPDQGDRDQGRLSAQPRQPVPRLQRPARRRAEFLQAARPAAVSCSRPARRKPSATTIRRRCKATLERLVDFDRINSGEMRLSVGATNVAHRQFRLFRHDDASHHGPSTSWPAARCRRAFRRSRSRASITGTAASSPIRRCNGCSTATRAPDTLAFQVDLWNARGELPRDLNEVDLRTKEIRYSSRTRLGTDEFQKTQRLRRAVDHLLKQLPEDRRNDPEWKLLESEADEKVYNVVHLIYRASAYEGGCKDFEFSRQTMVEHWKAGCNDTVRTLRHPQVLQRPTNAEGFSAYDLSLVEGE